MRFSVIIPVYNVEKYIEQCIDSVLGQSYADFELILVDDGSPDSCPEICDNYAQKDERVIVIHKENGGLSDARNAGIKISKGDYILFMDSDDFWTTTSVLEIINSTLNDNCSTIVQFGHEIYLHNKQQIVQGQQRRLSVYNGLPAEEVVNKLVGKDGLSISAWSMAVKRSFILENNLYFKYGIKTEDLEWAVRMFVCEPSWCFIDEYFYAYRKQHGGSIGSSVDYKHLCDYCWILENSIEILKKCKPKITEALMSYLMYHVLIASALSYRVKLDKIQRKGILSRLKAVCKGRITKYTLNKKVRLAGFLYRVGGFSFMSKVLGFYLNNRGR